MISQYSSARKKDGSSDNSNNADNVKIFEVADEFRRDRKKSQTNFEKNPTSNLIDEE